jgi:two-component system OmpR family response regulator
MVKVKILIVDDEEDYCMIMKNYFEEKNYDVHLAYNLRDGLHLIKEQTPDILFLDNNLPDGEGWLHTEEIVKENPSLKVNLISAYKQKTKEFDSYSNVKVWEKPISIDSLEEIFAA